MTARDKNGQTAKDRANEVIEPMGLTVDSEFIPFSQSRNKDSKYKSLNWRVTLKRNGREILATDCSAGIAHCLSYPKDGRITRDVEKAIEYECETGFGGKPGRPGSRHKPDSVDVIWSLVSDASVIDSGGFENWAAELGYDSDSRKAESLYKACLETALKLRAAIGNDGLEALQDVFQDYCP